MARGKDAAAGQKRVVYQLQLLGCTFRRALRKSGKRIIARLSGASSDSSPSEEEERCAAAAVCDLLEATDAAHRHRAEGTGFCPHQAVSGLRPAIYNGLQVK